MSRGFVKEDDQEEAPIIPPRAALPANTINYVTKNGLEALKAEKELLESEVINVKEPDERERRRAKAVLNGKLNLLNERLNSARLLENTAVDEIRFGATVSYTIGDTSKVHTLTIVGVDEADVKSFKIAFTAPIARALIGKKLGDVAELKLGEGLKNLKVTSISYSE